MMATGKAGYTNQMQNAYNIAQLFHIAEDQREYRGDLQAAEVAIDKLASLYAIKNTNPTTRNQALKIAKHELSRGEKNGISTLISMAANFKEQARERLFDGSKIQMIKGYVYENFDPDISVEVAPIDEVSKKRMSKKGYKLVKQMPKDRLDPNKEVLGLYVSKIGLAQYQKTVVSLTNEQHRGTDLFEAYDVTSKKDYSKKNSIKDFYKVRDKSMAASLRQFDDIEMENISNLVPVLDDKGNIVNYRYMMSEETKTNVLGKQDLAHESLGKMFASIEDRVNTKEVNRDVIKSLMAEYEKYRNNKSYRFIELSPYSRDEEGRRMWRMMPEDMKQAAIEASGGKIIHVRDDFARYFFGHRKFSFGQKAAESYGANVGNIVKLAEDVTAEIAFYLKLRQVILDPMVLFGNILSNIYLLTLQGVPISYQMKEARTAIAGMRKYQTDLTARDSLWMDMQSGNVKNMPQARAQLAKLDKDLKVNPVAALVQDGLFTSIVTEADPTREATTRRPITELFHKNVQDRMPKELRTGMREALMMPGSQIAQAFTAGHQYSDFVARFAKFKYETEVKKIDRKDAINRALDDFIYYDEPQGPMMSYLNDHGFLMFTKFYLRIQRVIGRLFIDKPASSAAFLVGQHLIHDLEDDVHEYFLNAPRFARRLSIVPTIQNLPDAVEPPIFSILDQLFGN
jgi:hypothetical protein